MGPNGEQGDTSSPGNMEHDPQYAPLYQFLRIGDWVATNKFLTDHPEAITASISVEKKKPLHVAALFGHLHIVEELLKKLSEEQILLPDHGQLTALHDASYGTNMEVAKSLVGKNKKLLTIPTHYGWLPVTRALNIGRIEMARYLYSVTPKEVFEPETENGGQLKHGAIVLNMCYQSQLFDMALDLLDYCPRLAVTPDHRGETFLEALASIPCAFESGCQLSLWQRWIYNRINIKDDQLRTFGRYRGVQHKMIQPNSANSDVSVNMPETSTNQSDNPITTAKKRDGNTAVSSGRKTIYQMKLDHMQARELLRIACQELSKLNNKELEVSRAHLALVRAAKNGVPEFFTEVLKVHLHLFWGGEKPRNPLFVAVQYRQAKVYSLIHGMNLKDAIANLTDYEGNILLHTAGLLAPSTQLDDISGAALQMQRELQWFEEVKGITSSLKNEAQNNDGKTARQLFTENHKELVKQGEKWMKGTATSCSVVAALVATVVFAAAFTVPGGNDQNTGYPIFSKKKGFMVFMTSDAISLISSSTSILMCLGILTSRYAERDFLTSLPTKLIIGLLTLFIAMATMLVAFCAALFVMFHGKLWIVIPVSILAAVPVLLFGWYQFPLLREMVMSTYWPRIFVRNVKTWL